MRIADFLLSVLLLLFFFLVFGLYSVSPPLFKHLRCVLRLMFYILTILPRILVRQGMVSYRLRWAF